MTRSTEQYGGACPRCGKPLLQQTMPDDREGYSLQFDACVWCGFAYGEENHHTMPPEEIWRVILKCACVTTREELIALDHLEPVVSQDAAPRSVFEYGAH